MKLRFLIWLVLAFNPGFGPRASGAEDAPAAAPPSAPAKLSTADLEKLAMPIALHPDQLIASILPAAAYPVEIVQAARFVKDTNNVSKVDEQPWDANVKAVAKFPDLIAKMDADIDWTVQLGQAFVDQPKELMDTIQSLRAKAQKAGTLKTTEQQIVTVTNVVVRQTNMTQVVTVTNQVVQVQPSNPQVVYVPSYPPTVYYPPPAYNPMAPLITFGVGMAWGAVLANNCNWGYGHVDVDVDVDRNVNRNVDRNSNRTGNRAGTTGANQKAWKPDQNRMRSSGAGGASASTRDARGWGSGQPSAGNRAAGPSTGAAGARPSTGTAGTRPSSGTAAQRPSTGTAGNRSSAGASSGNRPSPSASGRSSSGGSAFGGVSSGSGARSSASRGAASRGGGGGGRGGGGRR